MTVFLLINGSHTTEASLVMKTYIFLLMEWIKNCLHVQKKINCYQIPHVEYKRAKGDRKRAQHISNFAQELFQNYQLVLAMDIDEFLVLDPNQQCSLTTYLSQGFKSSSLSALGLDVGQHPTLEQPIDLKKPFLTQRVYAQVSDRYTKPIVALKPLNWGSGFHRVGLAVPSWRAGCVSR